MTKTCKCANCGELIYEDTTVIVDDFEDTVYCCLDCFKEYHGYKEVVIDTYTYDKLGWDDDEEEDLSEI